MKRIKLSDTKWFMLLLLMCVPIISSCSKEDLARLRRGGNNQSRWLITASTPVIRMPSREKTL